MGVRTLPPSMTASVTGANLTLNLAAYIMYLGEDHEVAANVLGRLAAVPAAPGNDIWIRVDNTAGSNAAWLCHGSEVPALENPAGAEETVPLNTFAIAAGSVIEFGPWDETAWDKTGLILRLIDGASVKVDVVRDGRAT